MELTPNDILNNHKQRVEETLEEEISNQAKIHRLIFENEITENLLKAYPEERQ